MIAYLLRATGYGCNAFLGGISVNYERNYWSSDNNTAVIEADEYDRSFLKLHPDIALLTSIDPDHLDIYGTPADMEAAFIQYTKNIKPGGTLLLKHGLHRQSDLKVHGTVTYSLQNDAADIHGDNPVQKDGGYIFDVVAKGWRLNDMHLPIGGMHNVENAIAAIAVTQMLEIEGSAVREALAGFKGVKRRFEYVVKTDKMVYIDDYAHHPAELAALIKSAKRLFAGRKCVVAFQPHLFSRTRDLVDGFAESLDMADEVILLDIYPARELPMEGVTSQIIADRMNTPHTLLSKEGLLEYVKNAPLSLFITAGAGDIDKLVAPVKNILNSK
jgi:UDP-N-acetylmuramate--alanine ligase